MRTAIASLLRLDNAMIGDHAVRVFFSASKAPVSSGRLGNFSVPSDPHQHEESQKNGAGAGTHDAEKTADPEINRRANPFRRSKQR